MPSRFASSGVSICTSSPSRKTFPSVFALMPRRASTVSTQPDPTSPYSPRISPLWTESEMSVAKPQPRCSTLRTSSPIGSSCLGYISAILRPTIISTSLPDVVSPTLTTPTRLPSRMTMIRSAIRSTSSSLWVM